MKDKKKKSQYKKDNVKPKKDSSFKSPSKSISDKTNNNYRRSSSIPKVVANRMARRIAFTTGVPTLLGMSVFIVSYIVIIKGIAEIAPSVTLTSSAICFLIGLIGLSYGILSASWDEAPGSLLGIENINPNINKLRSAFKPLSASKAKEEKN